MIGSGDVGAFCDVFLILHCVGYQHQVASQLVSSWVSQLLGQPKKEEEVEKQQKTNEAEEKEEKRRMRREEVGRKGNRGVRLVFS